MRLLKSMDLLQLQHDSPRAKSRECEEWITRFFTNFRNSNGSWKTTSRSRHRIMDDALIRILDRRAVQPQVVMDVGVASGATTLDLKEALDQHGFKARIIATDRTINGYVVRLHSQLDVLIEPSGHILKVELCGIDFSPWCSARDYVNGAFLVKVAVSKYTGWRLKRAGVTFPLNDALLNHGRRRLSIDGPYCMITPELKGRPDVTIVEDDILSPAPPALAGVADVVRLAHVIRPDRFSENDIRHIVRNVRGRCRDGATVIVCRSNPRARARGALEGSIFIAVPGAGFVLEDRIGPGSEVEGYFCQDARPA